MRLDPKFALGWALLSYVDAIGYITQTLQPTAALREEARQAAETALTLQPNLGEAIDGQGLLLLRLPEGLRQRGALLRAGTASFCPNNSRIPESLAYVGAQSEASGSKASPYFNAGRAARPAQCRICSPSTCFPTADLRRFPDALRKLDQVLDITPDDVDTVALKAAIDASREATLPRASALLAPLHPAADNPFALETQVYQAILERRPAPIIPRLKEILATPDPALGYFNGELRFWLGWAQEVAGDHAAAEESWQQARSELEAFPQGRSLRIIASSKISPWSTWALGDKAAAFAWPSEPWPRIRLRKMPCMAPLRSRSSPG